MEDLSNLKAGDKVIFTNAWGEKMIHKVEKITPKGYIKVAGHYFYNDGHGRTSSTWDACFIEEYTEEKAEEIKIPVTIKKCKDVFDEKRRTITYKQAKQILEILLPKGE